MLDNYNYFFHKCLVRYMYNLPRLTKFLKSLNVLAARPE